MHRRRQDEEEEEERKVEEYREIGMRLKGYPEEDVKKARRLVASFILAAEEVEEVIINYNSKIHYLMNGLICQEIQALQVDINPFLKEKPFLFSFFGCFSFHYKEKFSAF